ncbi:MAG TPA: cellulose binding domain-containing protein [Candidatus Angelobacter sp.]|nr:cellulose binding domain-containing protein [Candidatus Angelobacter sp.]
MFDRSQVQTGFRPFASKAVFITLLILSCALRAFPQTALKVQDRSHDQDSPDNNLYALYEIFNTGTTPVPMSTLTMRYWFTNESPADPLVFNCDFAQVSCSNITSRFVTVANPVPLADTYVEIGFLSGAGTLAPGANSGEIQTRVHKTDFLPMITVNDYSFISDPSFVYTDTTTVTLYLNGTLLWGVEPTSGSSGGDTQPPTTPTGLRVTGATTSSISLAWNASTDNVAVTQYVVLEGSAQVGSPTATSFTVTGLQAGTTYTFSVLAKDASGNASTPSASVTAQTSSGTSTGPTAPTGLQLGIVTPTSVALGWNPSTGGAGALTYDILNGGVVAASTEATAFTVTGLTPNTSYSFTVRAKDTAGNQSAPSSAVAVTTPPETPATLKVQDRSHDNDSPDTNLYGLFEIFNLGATPVPMSSLTMRYWFTNESPSDPLVWDCDYAAVSCANITHKFVTLAQPVPLADTYLELGFIAGAGAIAPGTNSGEIQGRIHKVDFLPMITVNDYSFISDPSFVYKDSSTVTLYLNGVLVWGVEPK